MEKLNQRLHAIRNPINTISMSAELAKVLIEQNRIEDLDALMDRILDQCIACSDVINAIEESRF